MSTERHRFQLWQDGIMVAAVDCAERHIALKEIAHYAAVYEQDGPVEIREVKRRKRAAQQTPNADATERSTKGI
jgi:hypothetical protein